MLGMRRQNVIIAVVAGLLALLLVLPGCSMPQDMENRISTLEAKSAALEAEVAALKEDARAREKALREELAMVRTNLGSIHSLLEMDKESAKAAPQQPEDGKTGDELNNELDVKAKTFVKENLDRLLSITRKLLDKMERELDKQEEPARPQAEGDTI